MQLESGLLKAFRRCRFGLTSFVRFLRSRDVKLVVFTAVIGIAASFILFFTQEWLKSNGNEPSMPYFVKGSVNPVLVDRGIEWSGQVSSGDFQVHQIVATFEPTAAGKLITAVEGRIKNGCDMQDRCQVSWTVSDGMSVTRGSVGSGESDVLDIEAKGERNSFTIIFEVTFGLRYNITWENPAIRVK